MTNVKLNVCRCGSGEPQVPGQIISVPDDEAARMIADNQAEETDLEPGFPNRPTKGNKRQATKAPSEVRTVPTEGRTAVKTSTEVTPPTSETKQVEPTA